MFVFLEVLSAILFAAKMIGMIDISTIKALLPLIVAVTIETVSTLCDMHNKRRKMEEYIAFTPWGSSGEPTELNPGDKIEIKIKKDDDESED